MDHSAGSHVGTDAREDIASLKGDVAYLRREVHGLRSKLHGELALLAVRIEDNERRAMRRRKFLRRSAMAAVVGAWLWVCPSALLGIFGGAFLVPGLVLVGMT